MPGAKRTDPPEKGSGGVRRFFASGGGTNGELAGETRVPIPGSGSNGTLRGGTLLGGTARIVTLVRLHR